MKFKKINIVWSGNSLGLNHFVDYKIKNGIKNSEHCKVLLMMKRSPNLLFAICMCLEKNITYIPIDPAYPKERIQYIIDNSNPDDIISDVELDVNFKPVKQSTSSQEDTAYILYTSGSTGSPKGVEVTREGLKNFIEGISEIIDFSESKRVACFTTVAFDIFLLESIMALYKGLTVVLANEDEQRSPKLMGELIVNNNVEMVQMTPSRMQLLLNYDKDLACLKGVKEIMIGGEPFPFNLLKALQEKTTAKIYNMYGPTETTIWSTVGELTQKNKIDIGRPIKNTEIYIVDESLSVLPDGKAGEICISGKGLAKGYVGSDDLTAEKFTNLPQKPDVRIYRTGDFGRYLPDGNLEYLGRMDNQVKIRGHRVELEEIETYINQFQGVSQSIVRVINLNESDKLLEAVYTCTRAVDKGALREYLTLKLPEYMVPTKFTSIESFLSMPNGKIDRNNISVPIEPHDSIKSPKTVDEMTELQRKALITIKSNLDESVFPNLCIDSKLSDVGIDSITFMKIVVSLEETFDFEFDDDMLIYTAFPSIKSMAEYVESKTDGK